MGKWQRSMDETRIMEHKSDKLLEVTLVRCFAVLTLVVHHTYCIYTGWGDVINSPYDNAYARIMSFLIPDANMPLFTFLAGYLLYYQLQRGKYSDGKVFLKNKIHRLLIPYIVLGSIVVYLKYGADTNIKEVLYGAPNHLWFCLMLFYCYVIYWCVDKKFGSFANACLAIMSLSLITHVGSMWKMYYALHWPLGVEIAAYYYFFFYLGGICRKYKEFLFQDWRSIILFSLIYVSVDIPIIRMIVYSLLIFAIAEMVYPLVFKSECTNSILNNVAECSFGIYVIHSIILWNISHYPPILKYTAPILEGHYIIAPVLLFVIVFFLSWGLTVLLLKTRVGKYLLA